MINFKDGKKRLIMPLDSNQYLDFYVDRGPILHRVKLFWSVVFSFGSFVVFSVYFYVLSFSFNFSTHSCRISRDFFQSETTIILIFCQNEKKKNYIYIKKLKGLWKEPLNI